MTDKSLTHLNERGEAHMVDVDAKEKAVTHPHGARQRRSVDDGCPRRST